MADFAMDGQAEQAMDKIRDEMAKCPEHDGIRIIGEYMSRRLTMEPAIEEHLEGKTLTGAFEKIKKYAQEHKNGNFAFVPPEKAYEIVNGYYGIPAAPAERRKEETQAHAPETKAPDALDLDALLGGL